MKCRNCCPTAESGILGFIQTFVSWLYMITYKVRTYNDYGSQL
ncbi:hypothetical protein QQO69_01540 [Clostridioides difficile]|nr:hypothetical protein [Clostridioides difficile]